MTRRDLAAAGSSDVQMKTMRQISEEKRQVKLRLMREQVQNGSLVIRRMTDEERRRYPQRPPDKRTS
jgi:hypothetical protein